MSVELVLVALISSGAALLSAILTARFTARSTRLQIDAQAETTRKQIEHQESEARRDRMIKARSNILTRIQDSLGSLFGAHSTFSSSIIGLQALNEMGIPPDDPGRKHMADEVERQAKIIQDATTNITALRPRISDRALVAIVDELTGEIGSIVHGGTVALPEDLAEKFLDVFAGLEGLRPKLPAFNQRIEELLSGDDLE